MAKGGGADGIQPLLAEAERLLNRGDTPAAKSTYIRAREQAKRQNSVAAEAAVAFGLGRLEHSNGQSDAARAAFNEALALYRQMNDAVAEVRVLVAFGDLEKDTFRGAQAKQYYRAAREQWAVVPEPKNDPHVVLNMDRAPLMLAGEARARTEKDTFSSRLRPPTSTVRSRTLSTAVQCGGPRPRPRPSHPPRSLLGPILRHPRRAI